MGKRRKHGMSKTPEYRAIKNAIARCTNPDHDAWENYGGRGIRVCDEWMDEFDGPPAFLAHIGPRPGRGYDLDRIDNDGHYEPGNVRWCKRGKNLRNKRTNRRITHDGRELTLSQWSRETGLSGALINYRLRNGWAVADALETPAGDGNKRSAKAVRERAPRYRALGESLTLRQWSERTGIKADTIGTRIKRYGWSVERAVTEPLQHEGR